MSEKRQVVTTCPVQQKDISAIDEMKDAMERVNKLEEDRLRRLAGMNVLTNPYLPPGTMIMMVSEDIGKKLKELQDG